MIEKRKIEIGLRSNGKKYNYLSFPMIKTGDTSGWSTSITIDKNIYKNLKEELEFAKKCNIEYTNLKEVLESCWKILNWIPKSKIKENLASGKLILKDEKKTKTYLMKDSHNNLYKIGKSINPKQRERTLQSEKPSINMVKVWNRDIERDLHKLYKDYRIRGEWFRLNKIQVKYICTNY
jgi:hypothetical protein